MRGLIAVLVCLCVAGIAGAAVPPTGALTQPRGAAGCLADDPEDNEDRCAVVPALTGASELVVSKDGKNAYVAIDGPAVLALSRSATGALRPLAGKAKCISTDGSEGTCTHGHAIPTEAKNVAITPDGRTVFVGGDSGIAALSRSAAGSLRQAGSSAGCVTDDGTDGAGTDGACADGTALNLVAGIAVSGDGRNLYAAASGADGVITFARSGSTIRQIRCATLTGAESGTEDDDGITPGEKVCDTARAVADARDVALSPNGRNLYVASAGDGLAVFSRGAGGALRQLAGKAGCFVSPDAVENDGCAEAAGLDRAHAVVVSPDGRFVYVGTPESVVPFARSTGTGALTRLTARNSCVGDGDGCASARGVSLLWSLAISPDGRNLYTVSEAGVAVFSRNASTGLLTQLAGRRGCQTDAGGTCAQARAVIALERIAIAPGGRDVYVSSPSRATIGVFRRG